MDKVSIILTLIIIVLIIIIITAFKSINYILLMLDEVLEGNSNRRIMTNTYIKPIKLLIVKINKIIEKIQLIQNENLSKENSMKKMISNISHDFRTPLTSMLGYMELILESKNLSADDRRYLDIVYDKGLNLSKTFEEFFVISKLNSNDIEIKLAKINLCELIRKNIILFFNDINKKGIEPIINLPKEDVYFISDEKLMCRIIINIINNSLIHGTDATIIGVNLNVDDKNVCIEMYDNGIGIGEGQIEYIFDRLYMGEESRNQKIKGSGLGLSIVKKIVEVLNGNITVESIPYKKTSFKIIFPKDLRNL